MRSLTLTPLPLVFLLAGLAVAQEAPAGEAPSDPAAKEADEKKSDEKQKDGDEPEFKLSLYLFVPARIQGRAGVAGVDLDIDTTFADVYNNADVGGLAARAEMWIGLGGVVLDGYYSRVEVEEARARDLPPGQVNQEFDLEFRLGIVDILAGLRPLNLSLGDLVGLRLELLTGARIVDFKQEVELTTGGTQVEAGDSHNWVEIAVGIRATVKVWWFYAVAGGDISGFGIGSASDYIANLMLGVGFRPVDVFSIELAYRVLDMDYDRGSGADELSFDVTQHGPQLTFALHF